MDRDKLLEKNGWTIECQSPFEIRHYDGSFATMNAAYAIVENLRNSSILEEMSALRDAFKFKLITEKVFTDRMMKII